MFSFIVLHENQIILINNFIYLTWLLKFKSLDAVKHLILHEIFAAKRIQIKALITSMATKPSGQS